MTSKINFKEMSSFAVFQYFSGSFDYIPFSQHYHLLNINVTRIFVANYHRKIDNKIFSIWRH